MRICPLTLTVCLVLSSTLLPAGDDVVIAAHDRPIAALAASGDGSLIATGSDDGVLKIWDGRTGKLRQKLTLDSAITALAIQREGNRLAVGGWDGQVILVDATTGERTGNFAAHRENITSIEFHPTKKQLATASGDDTLKIWDLPAGKLIHTLDSGNEYDVTCLAYSPDGRWLASGDGEGTVQVWDCESGESRLQTREQEERIAAVAWSADGPNILSGSWDDTVRIFDSASGGELKVLHRHTDDVTALAVSRKSKRILSAGADGRLLLFEASAQEPLLERRSKQAISHAAVSDDGRRLAFTVDSELHLVEVLR